MFHQKRLSRQPLSFETAIKFSVLLRMKEVSLRVFSFSLILSLAKISLSPFQEVGKNVLLVL